MKRWVQFIWGCIHPPIQGVHTWEGQCKDILVQVPFLISAQTVTRESMATKEVYTPVGHHFGDGFNMERFKTKRIIFIIMYVFGEMASDRFSYHHGKSIVPLRVQVLKQKTSYLRFSMTAPQAVLKFS